MAVPRPNNASGNNNNTHRASRKQSLNGLSLHLCFRRLGRFLQGTLPRYANDSALTSAAEVEHRHLVDRLDRQPPCSNNINNINHLAGCCRDELSQIDEVLAAFIASPMTQLPPDVVFEVHSLRGLIQSGIGRNELATQSYMKALWIASSTDEVIVPRAQLALTMHHLGKAYGGNGNHERAILLLEKVLIEYEKLKIPTGHVCVVDAKSSIQNFDQQRLALVARQERSKLWSSFSGYEGQRLSFIAEEDESDRCLSV